MGRERWDRENRRRQKRNTPTSSWAFGMLCLFVIWAVLVPFAAVKQNSNVVLCVKRNVHIG